MSHNRKLKRILERAKQKEIEAHLTQLRKKQRLEKESQHKDWVVKENYATPQR